MSALSNGSMKYGEKQETFSDIGAGIVSGRGFEVQVEAKKINQQTYLQPVAMSLSEEITSMEELDTFIENSSLSVESKEAAKTILHEKLLSELEKGEEASVTVVKTQLEEFIKLTHTLPDMRHDLRTFIENYTGVSKTIRLMTHKLLD